MKRKIIQKGQHRWYPCDRCVSDHPSTTTILDVIGSPALMGWAAKNGTVKLKEYAKAVQEINPEAYDEAGKRFDPSFWKAGAESAKEAADFGTIAHAAFEMFLKGKEVDTDSLPEPSRNAFSAFREFSLKNITETISTETTFYNCSMGYAGTADWRGFINGKLSLADWKTSSGIFEKNIIQAWANAIADEMEHGNYIYDQIVIGRFGKDGTSDILIVPRKGFDNGFCGYEQARILIQACVPWFHYKQGWESKFPFKRKNRF